MDSDFPLDVEEVLRNIEEADVICFSFPLLSRTLLIDTRSNEVEGPAVKVRPRVHSMEERIRSIRRLRPRLSRPENLSLIRWPKYVDSLQRSGVWAGVLARVAGCGDAGAGRDGHKAYKELMRRESHELSAALRGERYPALWERTKRG